MKEFSTTAFTFGLGQGIIGSLSLGLIVLWISLTYWRSETRKVGVDNLSLAPASSATNDEDTASQLNHIPTVGTTFPIISYLGTIRYLFSAKEIVDEGISKVSSSQHSCQLLLIIS